MGMDWRYYMDMEAVLRDINYSGGIDIDSDEQDEIISEHKDDFLDTVENHTKKYVLSHNYIFNIYDEDLFDDSLIEYEIDISDYSYDYIDKNNYEWEDDFLVSFRVEWSVILKIKYIAYDGKPVLNDIDTMKVSYENSCYMGFDR